MRHGVLSRINRAAPAQLAATIHKLNSEDSHYSIGHRMRLAGQHRWCYRSLMRAILVIISLLWASTASAQTWQVAPNTTQLNPADVAQLPYSVTFSWAVQAPWQPLTGQTWTPVWPRNALGAWYRPSPYSQPSAVIRKWQPYAYRCEVSGAGFRCLDKVRAVWRSVACPSQMQIAWMPLWRSQYRGEWPELGLFSWDRGPFAATVGRYVQLQRAVVTGDGQVLNCMYGNPTAQGPGTLMDVWVFRR